MAKLVYTTRNQTSPQGLPKVYYACQGQEPEKCFEEISEDILALANCAVYHYEGEPEQDEIYFQTLSQMNLVVIPVTDRLLMQANRAMDVEFPYAVKHNIPVLPLVQQPGLEQLFNQRFGSLQYLYKYDPDVTALPFGEKLKKYLDAVLIGDELAAQVRSAFDAYIFLSYRKKDRQHAQALMKLVHQLPLCRDVAIWYDEFLVPGENFNDAIRTALEKSDLFLMTVTPNLVCETNYIMSTEYPAAQRVGIPVLAAEMVETSAETLKAHYVGIGDSVDPTDAERFAELLVSGLRSRSLRRETGNSRHDLFIGLAYLIGIDVEVDRERALELITSAAKAGLPEAMEKLAQMYRNGEGVSYDYDRQIEWLKKVVDCRRVTFQNTGTLADGIDYIRTELELVRGLVFDYAPPFNHKADRQWFLRAQRYCKAALHTAEILVERHLGEEAERALLRCRTEQGRLLRWYTYYRNGKIRKACRWYRLAEQTARKLAERTDDSRDWLAVGELIKMQIISDGPRDVLSKRMLALAEDRSQKGDWDTAELGVTAGQNLYVEATDDDVGRAVGMQTLALARRLVQNRGLVKDLLNVCETCEQLGYVLRGYGDGEEAEQWLYQALQELQAVPKTVSADITAAHEVPCCIGLGLLCVDRGCKEEAVVWFQRSLDVWQWGQQEKKQHHTPVRFVNTSVAMRWLARLNYEMGKHHEAEQWYRKLMHRLWQEAKCICSEKTTVELVDLCMELGKQQNDRKIIQQARRFNYALIRCTGGKKAYLKRDRELSKLMHGSANSLEILGIRYVFWSLRNLFISKNSAREKRQYPIHELPDITI